MYNHLELFQYDREQEGDQPFKKESKETCMFHGQNIGPPLSSGNVYQPPQHGHGAMNPGRVRPESLEVWPQTQGDIEMDNVPSMRSVPMPPPSYPYKPSYSVLGHPHELDDYSKPGWSPSQQSEPQITDYAETFADVDDVSMETVIKQESMSYQLDELGEW